MKFLKALKKTVVVLSVLLAIVLASAGLVVGFILQNIASGFLRGCELAKQRPDL